MVVAFTNVLALHQITVLLKTEEEENFEKEVIVKGQRMKGFLKIPLDIVADVVDIEYLNLMCS